MCFSIYGTLGEPHLALGMSSLMYYHLSIARGKLAWDPSAPAGCAAVPAAHHSWHHRRTGVRLRGKSRCISFWVLVKWEKYHFFSGINTTSDSVEGAHSDYAVKSMSR